MLISIVVPVYNEAEALVDLSQGVRQELTRLGQPWEIIFINDGSKDSSAAILDRLADSDQRIRVIHFKRNSGQTAAMMAGFDFAQGDVIIPLDGDGQNDPADIPRMLNLIDQGFDVVSGWRKDRQDNVIQRNIPSILANRLISAVSGVRLHDFGCSLKAYKRQVVDGIRLYGEMHRFLPIYASWHGAKIAELVVNHHPRRTGESKYGFERVFKVLLDLLVVKFLDRVASKPMYLFGGCGVFSLAISGIAFLCMLYLERADSGGKVAAASRCGTTQTILILCLDQVLPSLCDLRDLLVKILSSRALVRSTGSCGYFTISDGALSDRLPAHDVRIKPGTKR